MSGAKELTATIRVRMSASDAHYGGYLVNGAHMLALFGDVATELAILCDGDEGLLVGYENVEFLAPLFAGDYVEASGRITRIASHPGAAFNSVRCRTVPPFKLSWALNVRLASNQSTTPNTTVTPTKKLMRFMEAPFKTRAY